MSTRGEGFRHFLCRPFGRGAPLRGNRTSKQAGDSRYAGQTNGPVSRYRRVSVSLFNEMGPTGGVKGRSLLLPTGALDGSLAIRILRPSRLEILLGLVENFAVVRPAAVGDGIKALANHDPAGRSAQLERHSNRHKNSRQAAVFNRSA